MFVESIGDFSQILLEESGQAPAGKSHNIEEAQPHHWMPLEFLIFRVVCTKPPVICQLQFSFPYLGAVCHSGFHL